MRTDKDIARQRSRIGMVFQRFNLFPHMTALENVMEAPVQVKGVARREVDERGPGAAGAWSASPTAPGITRRSSPAASSSGSPSPEPWR